MAHSALSWLDILVKIAFPLTMLSVGMTEAQFRRGYFRRNALLTARALLAALVIVPLLMITVGALLPLPLPAKAALAMLAISPGAHLAPERAMKIGGHPIFTSHLFVALGLLGIGSVPLSLLLLGHAFGYSWSIHAGEVARTVLVESVIPIFVGVGLGRWLGERGRKLSSIVKRASEVATVALVLVMFLLVVTRAGALFTPQGLVGVGAFMLVALLGLGIGHAMGGPGGDTRRSLAVVSTLRNGALALLLSRVNFPELNVLPAIFGYIIAGGVASLIYGRIATRGTSAGGHDRPAQGHHPLRHRTT